MPFMNLPTEIVIIIAKALNENRDLAMLARTCRFLYNVANPILYARNAKNEGSSALLWAGKTGIVETASLNAYADDHRTALIHAADNGQIKLAELLLACPAAYISACDIEGNSATFLAARNDSPEMLLLLLRHGADAGQVHRDANPGQMDIAGDRPLSRAVKSRSLAHVNLLLKWDAGHMTGPIDFQDDPLRVAIERQYEDILRLLLGHNVQSFAMDLANVAALPVAVFSDKERAVQVLLEEGAVPDQRTWKQMTPLHLAADAKSLEMTRILVQHGASSQLLDENNDAPHHMAARNGQVLIVQFLLANDPDPVVREYFLKTPINEYDRPETEAVLLTKWLMGSRLAYLLQNPTIEEDLRARR